VGREWRWEGGADSESAAKTLSVTEEELLRFMSGGVAMGAGHRGGAGGRRSLHAEEEALPLSEYTVVEFRLLGSEQAPQTHTGAMRLLWSLADKGYLWGQGIRALRMQGGQWEIVARACPRGDRYNDLPCEGRGQCSSGVCLCKEEYSGQRCQIKAIFSGAFNSALGQWCRLVALGVLGLGTVAHALAWVISCGIFNVHQRVTGDYWSLWLNLQVSFPLLLCLHGVQMCT
jgi:hypothetical protein